jgi:hypothetical protein
VTCPTADSCYCEAAALSTAQPPHRCRVGPRAGAPACLLAQLDSARRSSALRSGVTDKRREQVILFGLCTACLRVLWTRQVRRGSIAAVPACVAIGLVLPDSHSLPSTFMRHTAVSTYILRTYSVHRPTNMFRQCRRGARQQTEANHPRLITRWQGVSSGLPVAALTRPRCRQKNPLSDSIIPSPSVGQSCSTCHAASGFRSSGARPGRQLEETRSGRPKTGWQGGCFIQKGLSTRTSTSPSPVGSATAQGVVAISVRACRGAFVGQPHKPWLRRGFGPSAEAMLCMPCMCSDFTQDDMPNTLRRIQGRPRCGRFLARDELSGLGQPSPPHLGRSPQRSFQDMDSQTLLRLRLRTPGTLPMLPTYVTWYNIRRQTP